MGTEKMEPRPWALTSTPDEMVQVMQEAVHIARLTHQRSVDEQKPDSMQQASFRAWRIRADVLHVLLNIRDVDPELMPESFTEFANAVAEQMAFLRKTMREYKELSREKADLKQRYDTLVAQHQSIIDQVDDARRAALFVTSGA